MNLNEFMALVSAMQTYYPRENLVPNDAAKELWFRALCDIPRKVAEMALERWVLTNKWSPSIADLREQAAIIINGDKPEWSEGWALLRKAFHDYGEYGMQHAMKLLRAEAPITYEVTKRLGYLNLYWSEHLETDRANFRMIFEELANKKHQEQTLPENMRQAIDEMRRGQLQLEGGSREG